MSKGLLSIEHRKNGVYWRGVVRYRVFDEEIKVKSGRKSFVLREYDKKPIPIPTDSQPNKGRTTAERALNEAIEQFKLELTQQLKEEARMNTPQMMRAKVMREMPIPDFVKYYIDSCENGAIKQLEPSTIAAYRNMNKSIAHYFSNMKLCDLTALDIDNWKADMQRRNKEGEKIGQSTQVKIFNLLQSCYSYAEKRDIIDRSPFYKVDKIKKPKPNPNPLTDESFTRLCALIEAAGLSHFTIAVRIAIEAGMREGEICGLQWGDVDLDEKLIRVRRSLARADGKVYLKEPKTYAGKREIPISPRLTKVLKEWRIEQLFKFSEFKGAQSKETFVVGDVNGNPYNPLILSKDWRMYSKANNIVGTTGKRAVFHDLRHTYVSRLAEIGTDPKTMSQLAGHASVKTTLDIYADSSPRAKRAAIDNAASSLWCVPKEAEIIPFRRTGTD